MGIYRVKANEKVNEHHEDWKPETNWLDVQRRKVVQEYDAYPEWLKRECEKNKNYREQVQQKPWERYDSQ